MNLAVKILWIFFYNEFGCKNFSIFFTMNLAVKIFWIFFYNEFGCKNFSIFFTMNLAVKIFRIFLCSRINFFFFVVKNEKSSHVSQTPYLVSMLFSRPRWSFLQGVPNILGIPFKTFSSLFRELKRFWGNLGPHVSWITLWRQVKIMLCTNIYEKFDRKKKFELFFTLNLAVKCFWVFFYIEFNFKIFFKIFWGKIHKTLMFSW